MPSPTPPNAAPWHAQHRDDDSLVLDRDGHLVAHCTGWNHHANAELVAQAVNEKQGAA